MAHRSKPSYRSDHKRFTRTAVRSKKINLDPRPMRGGIRL